MQNTLLGLAIAIILALVAALVGPLLIDWGNQRAFFESEASRLLGAQVRIAGPIDARLLPTPQLTVHDITVGGDAMRARSLGVEFALGPLMRGQWRASELHLTGPQLGFSVDAKGSVQMPAVAVAFEPDSVAIERLTIEDGTLALADTANGSAVKLEQLSFNGDARSLLGPFKGDGRATVAGQTVSYRLATGRYGDDDTIKLRLTVEPADRPLSIETDGNLTLAEGTPSFEGGLTLTRPVGIAAQANTIRQPWRLTGKLSATAQSALLKNLEFQYGSEDQGFKLTGDADVQFGKNPRFDGVLSGRQLDVDRAFAANTGERPLPATAIRDLAELVGGAFQPTFPIQIGIGIDQVTLGGGIVQNLRGDLSSDASGWNLDRFEFRGPGFTQVRLSGHLAVDKDSVAFTGPADISSNDPNVLAAWLSGAGDATQGTLRPFNLRGEVTLASDRVAIEHLNAEFDRKPVTGRLVYGFARQDQKQPARLEVEANAPELDLDAALGFGNALLAGSKIDQPHDVMIAADIGRTTFAGFAARGVSARMKVNAGGLQIERLAVADLGGAAFSASGNIIGTAPAPRGTLQCDLDLSDMTPVMALLGRFAPDVAQAVGSVAPAMAPAKLHARLSVDGAAQRTTAKLAIDGSLGKVRLALNGQTDADPVAFSIGAVRLEMKLDAEDGKALIGMLGLDRVAAVGPGAAVVSVSASGPLRGELKIESSLTAGGLDATMSGTARPWADTPTATLRATLVKVDMAPLRGPGGGALPVALTATVALSGKELSLADINGTIAGTVVRGRLDYTLARPNRLHGEIDADRIDAAALIAAAIGMPAAPANGKAVLTWSGEPFGEGAFGDYAGEIAIKAKRLDLLSQVVARDAQARLRLGENDISFDDVSGHIAGGRLTAQASFHHADDGLKAQMKLSMSGANASDVIVVDGRPIAGTFGMAGEVAGSGLSPVALIGALQGAVKVSLDGGQLAGLGPRVFETVTRAVDQGLPIEATRIADAANSALASEPMPIKHVEGAIAIGAGQARMATVRLDATDGTLSLSGNLDLTNGAIDARMALTGMALAAGARPDLFMALKGPIASPTRTIDSDALTAWLTLRSVEMQSKQLREMERQTTPPEQERAPALAAPTDIRPAPKPMRDADSPASLSPHN